jgi:hypothetical protein
MLKSLKKKIKIFALILCSFYNCAWRDTVVRIDTTKTPTVLAKFHKGLNISLKVDYKNITMQSDNQRKDGIKKNGPGWETASIFFEPDGSEILHNAFIIKLNNKYFNVNNYGKDLINIDIIINQFFIEPFIDNYKMLLISVIDVDVIVRKNNRKYIRRFKSIKKDENSMELNYKNAVEDHLDTFTSQVVLEIDDLINKNYSKKK